MREVLRFTNKYNLHPQAAYGNRTYGEPVVLWWGNNDSRLTVGKFCSIAGNVQIYLGGNHHTEWVTTYPLASLFGVDGYIESFSKGDIIIGNDVLIHNNVSIFSGVTIGNGAVIAAGSVVTKDVPAYSLVAGNPATVKKFRFDDQTIEALEKICWWNWPDERIKENMALLLSPHVNEFITKAVLQ